MMDEMDNKQKLCFVLHGLFFFFFFLVSIRCVWLVTVLEVLVDETANMIIST